MKKIMLIVLMIFGVSTFWVQAQNSFEAGAYDLFMMIDGNVLRIRDSNQVELKSSFTMNDGTVVNIDGSYSAKDHEKFQLLEGECLDNDGVKYRNEHQYRYKIEQENNGLNEAQIQAKNRKRYHVMLIKGQPYQIINYEQYFIQKPVDIGHGRTLNPDGIHRTPYGHSRLKEGGCLNVFGKPFISAYEYRKVIIRRESKAEKKLLGKESASKNKESLHDYWAKKPTLLLNTYKDYFQLKKMSKKVIKPKT